MKQKAVLSVLFLFFVLNAFSQSLNEYKYIIIPKNYNFLQKDDQYQLNSLTKFLFEKEGFITLFDNEIKPDELVQSPCSGLITKVNDNSNMFTTKLTIELVDCEGETVFTSAEGRSKEKEFKRSFHGAFRDAFNSIKVLNYTYTPRKDISEKMAVTNEPEINEEEDNINTDVPFKVIKKESKEASEKISDEKSTAESFSKILYAQPNELGYQLIDNTPKVIYILLRTNSENLFILENKKGILSKIGEKWILEYYEYNMLIKKELQIKF